MWRSKPLNLHHGGNELISLMGLTEGEQTPQPRVPLSDLSLVSHQQAPYGTHLYFQCETTQLVLLKAHGAQGTVIIFMQ